MKNSRFLLHTLLVMVIIGCNHMHAVHNTQTPVHPPDQSIMRGGGRNTEAIAEVVRLKVGEVLKKLNQLASCDPTPITGPTTISVSGHYCLSKSFDVAAGNGITITASNVVLDLNNKTISGTGGDNGVVITGNEVIVKNGSIQDMAENGILVQGNKNRVLKCELIGNKHGVRLESANTNSIEHCNALCNSSAGFSLFASNNNVVRNCNALSNGDSSDIFGFVSESGECNLFQECLAEDTVTTGTSAIAAGFVLRNGELRSKIISSQASNTEGADAFGIWLRGGVIVTGTIALDELATFTHGITIFSVDWQVCGTRKFLAIGGSTGTDDVEVRVLEFNAKTSSLTELASFDHEEDIRSVDWQVCGTRKFLAIGGVTDPSDDVEVRVLEFNTTTNDLSQLTTFTHGDTIFSVDWQVCGTRKFLAIVGNTGTGSLEVRVLEFNTTTNSLTELANFDHGATIRSVDWQVCGTRKFVAIGGLTSSGIQVRVLEFNTTTNSLSELATFAHGTTIRSVDWQVCGTRKFVAIGGLTSSGIQVRVLEFNTTTNSLAELANFDHGATIRSVDWQICGTRKFVAIGGLTSSGIQVRVLEFNTATNGLTELATFTHGNEIDSVDWQVCDAIPFLAIGGTPSAGVDVRVLELEEVSCEDVDVEPQCCVIKKNHVTGTTSTDADGTGIQDDRGDLSTNQIYTNFSCKNDINYNIGTQFPITSAQAKGVGTTENIDCDLTAIEAPSVDEGILSRVEVLEILLNSLIDNLL